MPKTQVQDDTYDLLETESQSFLVGNRTVSTALLAWFLETVWRMDPLFAEDAICDGVADKGIDAVDADSDLKEITIFQSKHYQSAGVTQGDADLKQFVGVAHYFDGQDGIDSLLASSPNKELQKLVARLDLHKKLEEPGWSVRLVFVTNGNLDPAGRSYLESRADQQPPLDVWDRARLRGVAERTESLKIKPETVTLGLGSKPIIETLEGETRMAAALVPAPELVRLPGIDDLTLFDLNVRLGLGKTRINNDLAATIGKSDEHALFPAYHNGLTLLSRRVTFDKKTMTLEGVSVVNGCQSLLQLYANRAAVTPKLRVLVKVIELGDSLDLADRITYRTNNQNAVNQRDLRSTDPTQRDLQKQVADLYGSEMAYSIRAGAETGGVAVLDNTTAAQLLMAAYLREPWNSVRKVRLFDQDYHRIFKRDITAHHLYLLLHMDRLVVAHRSKLLPELQASFASVRLTLVYLLAHALALLPPGDELLAHPERWLPDRLAEVQDQLRELLEDIVGDLNYYVGDKVEEDSLFDPKVVFKSKSGITPVERDVARTVLKARKKDPEYGFHLALTPTPTKSKVIKKSSMKKAAAAKRA